jgi:DNA-binding GntR family transcriptional regulator
VTPAFPSSPSPLVLKVRHLLLEQLARLHPGDRVPLETEIGAQCAVSRTTVRKALQSLEDDGIITRRDSQRVLVRAIRASDQIKLLPVHLPKDQEVARWLLGQVGQGKIRPGQRFSERAIARQLNCSCAPVREALLSLSPLGLFHKDNRRQWQALSPTHKLIRELTEMRLLVEDYGLAKLLEPEVLPHYRPDLKDLRRHTQQLLSPQDFDGAEFLKADIGFHQLLLKATDNELLAKRHQFIYAMIEFQLQNADFTSDRARLGLTQHLHLIDAILQGRNTDAHAALKDHLLTAQQTLLQLLPRG